MPMDPPPLVFRMDPPPLHAHGPPPFMPMDPPFMAMDPLPSWPWTPSLHAHELAALLFPKL